MPRTLIFNKPFNVLSQFTDKGNEGAERQTLSDFIDVPGVYAAGRLDRDSEGLLVLTDDGRLQARIANPKHKMAKTYWVQVEGIPSDEALQALREVIERYPDSQYANAARLKFDLAYDHLASKEMEIGRYYLKRDNFAAAANRFRVVVEDFQTTTHTPEALHRLVESYVALGIDNEAQQVASVLGYNFPGSTWYQDSYDLLNREGITLEVDPEREDPSYFERAWRRLFG